MKSNVDVTNVSSTSRYSVMAKRMSGAESSDDSRAATESMLVFSWSISSPIEPVASRRNSTSTATGAVAPPAASAANVATPPGSAVTVCEPTVKSKLVASDAP